MEDVGCGFSQEFPQGCSAAEIITDMRIDIGEMRADLRNNTKTIEGYAHRLDAVLNDHEKRLRCIESDRAQTVGGAKALNYLKDLGIGLLGALAGLTGGRAF